MRKVDRFAQDEQMSKSEARTGKLFRTVGIMLVVIIPSAFWTTVIVFVCHWLSLNLGLQMVLLIGCSICLFLGTIYATIVVGASRSEDLEGGRSCK